MKIADRSLEELEIYLEELETLEMDIVECYIVKKRGEKKNV